MNSETGDKQQTLTRCFPHSLQSRTRLSNGFGGVLRLGCDDNVPLVCSGENGNCQRLGDHAADPSLEGIFKDYRVGAASVVIRNGTTLWVTGGFERPGGSMPTTTTEWIDFSEYSNDGGDSIKRGYGVDLPGGQDIRFHCLVVVASDLAVLFGGSDDHNSNSATWTIQITDNILEPDGDSWTNLNVPMLVARFHHSCGVIKSGLDRSIIVAAGGFVEELFDNEIIIETIDHVEILEVVSEANIVLADHWEEGPRLPIKLAGAGSAATGDHTKLFLGGGKQTIGFSDYSESVFYLTCVNDGWDCEWTKDNMELLYKRSYQVALVVPPPHNNQVKC